MEVKEQIFLDYIKLRYQARLTPRQTGDEIIDNYYFCNIKREWDKVSMYIQKNIIEAKFFRTTTIKMSFEDKLRNLFLARMHNKIETLEQYNVPDVAYSIKDEEILKKQNPHSYRTQKLLERLKQQTPGWKDSCWCVGNHLKEVLPDKILKEQDWSTFKRAILSWATVTGLSPESFIVYQLALDLEWMFNYKDIDSFYILGPGAIRGMNMIYFKDQAVDRALDNREEFNLAMKECVTSGEPLEIISPIYAFETAYELPSEKLPEPVLSKEEFSGELKGVDYNKSIKDLQTFVNNSQWAKDNNLYIHINDIEFNLCEFNKWYSKKMGWKTTIRKYER